MPAEVRQRDRRAADRSVVGLIVNPVAGLGGRVGLKGTDGAEVVALALELGARPEAPGRATAAIRRLVAEWPRGRPAPRFVAGPGTMGEASVLEAGVAAEVVRTAGAEPVARGAPGRPVVAVGTIGTTGTMAADTRQLALRLAEVPVDLLLVAGGDGTARDVAAAVGLRVPVLGIPAGVKMHSAVFATSPVSAGALAAAFLASARRRTEEREVLDLDEAAYRRGEVAPRLHGYLRTPVDRAVQTRKAPAAPDDAAAAAGIAERFAGAMVPGVRYVLGPGTTLRAVAERLGLPKTLVGIDVVEIGTDGPRVVAADVGERELLAALGGGRAKIVVAPVGGQGFLLGRGNQPLSPAVLRAAGADPLLIVATPGKLAALGGRPLLVDTGDPDLDRSLEGYVRVITGARETAVARLAAA
jgi:predicted polyphosphate/ATP-dependent NAD kinase